MTSVDYGVTADLTPPVSITPPQHSSHHSDTITSQPSRLQPPVLFLSQNPRSEQRQNFLNHRRHFRIFCPLLFLNTPAQAPGYILALLILTSARVQPPTTTSTTAAQQLYRQTSNRTKPTIAVARTQRSFGPDLEP